MYIDNDKVSAVFMHNFNRLRFMTGWGKNKYGLPLCKLGVEAVWSPEYKVYL